MKNRLLNNLSLRPSSLEWTGEWDSCNSIFLRTERQTMSNAFTILSKFLDRHGDDVEGRSMEEPSADVRQQLKRFAAGSLSEAERKDVIALLQTNPHWVPLLAREAEALRTNT